MSPKKSQALLKAQLSSWGEHIPRSQKLLFISIGIVVLTGTLGMIAIQGPWAEKRHRLLEEQQQEQDRSTLLLTIQRQAAQLEKQKKMALLQGGASILISEISRLANKAGIQIDSVVPKTEVNFGPFTKLQIEVEATANLQKLLNFLNSLAKHEPLLKVDRLEVGEIPLEESSHEEVSTPPPAKENQKTTLLISAFFQQGASP